MIFDANLSFLYDAVEMIGDLFHFPPDLVPRPGFIHRRLLFCYSHKNRTSLNTGHSPEKSSIKRPSTPAGSHSWYYRVDL